MPFICIPQIHSKVEHLYIFFFVIHFFLFCLNQLLYFSLLLCLVYLVAVLRKFYYNYFAIWIAKFFPLCMSFYFVYDVFCHTEFQILYAKMSLYANLSGFLYELWSLCLIKKICPGPSVMKTFSCVFLSFIVLFFTFSVYFTLIFWWVVKFSFLPYMENHWFQSHLLNSLPFPSWFINR